MPGIRGRGGRFTRKATVEREPVHGLVIEAIHIDELKSEGEMLNKARAVIGEVEDGIEIPDTSRGGKAVWKDALALLAVGQSRTVAGIGKKSVEQSVYKAAKHFPDRKFRVFVYEEVLRVGRLT